jgi:hypothetical protein
MFLDFHGKDGMVGNMRDDVVGEGHGKGEGPGGRGQWKGGHECSDPQCIGGTIMLDLNDEADFHKAVSVVESNIMNASLAAHRALRDGREEEADRCLDELIAHIESATPALLPPVLASIADAAAGMYLRIAELEGEGEA